MTLTSHRQINLRRVASLLCYAAVLSCVCSQAQKKSRYKCDEIHPEAICSPSNTCGSASDPCVIDVTRSASSSNVQPRTPGGGKNQPFCIKAGTAVVFLSSKKNNGFMVSFGTGSPLDPDDPIMGGGSKHVRRTAVTPGCYKFDAGAFTSGTVYGMSGGSKQELIILP